MKHQKMHSHEGEWQAFKAMSPRQKLDHIVLYYRMHILVALAVCIMLASLFSLLKRNSKDMLISGMFLNNAAEVSGYTLVTDEYLAYCGGQAGQRTALVEGRQLHYEEDPLPQEDASVYMILASMVSTGQLDYIITDIPTAHYLDSENILCDPFELLPDGTRPEAITNASGQNIGLSLDGTKLAEEGGLYCDDSCIVIIRNIENTERVKTFLKYIYTE